LRLEGKLSDNEVFQGYLSDLRFAVPSDFPNAKSIVVLAVSSKVMLVDFHLNGKTQEVMVPPGYYSTGLNKEILQRIVVEEMIKKPGCRIERATGVHLKLLAVRSGLGKYGRNNLVYVDGMGSLLRLFAYFTDYELQDNWTELTMMKCIAQQIVNTSDCQEDWKPLRKTKLREY
jgi:epoxyqueuosine reductase